MSEEKHFYSFITITIPLSTIIRRFPYFYLNPLFIIHKLLPFDLPSHDIINPPTINKKLGIKKRVNRFIK